MMTPIESLVRRRGGALFLALSLAGCDVSEVLDVPDPDVATPISILDKSALPTVLAGAQADFMVAYNGNQDISVVTGSGLFTDELIWAETFPTRFEIDARSIQSNNATMTTLFRNMHRARVSAARAAAGFAQFDTANVGWAEALNLEGLTYIWFGENYCNGVPFSSVDVAGNQLYGDPITNDAMFAAAVVRFDSALKVIGTKTSAAAVLQSNVAKTSKARTLLNQNQTAAAVTALTGVPNVFSYTINHSDNTTRQYNGSFEIVVNGRRFSVGQAEGGTGLTYRTDAAAGDPRIPNSVTGVTPFDNSTPMFVQQKYTARTTPIVVSNGIEARLIAAEVNMRTNGATWLATLNSLRTSNTPAMAGTLVDPGTQAGREDLFFKEREYWLWLTGHRLGDVRRLVRQYARPTTAVFPNGAYFKGGTYGSDFNFPVPFDEQNNPKFKQCIDRDP
jgi:starch-binding outer membrane protein, SusD/RagB family